jgi:lipopolysaccharide exporter
MFLDKFKFKSDFLKYTVVLMSGTVMAQVLAYFFAPVITRLYTPEQSAELGLFIRIISVGAALATARYEFALPIPKSDSHSFRLYHFALRSTVVVTLISIVILIVPLNLSNDNYAFVFYGLIPVGIFFMAIYNIGTNWAVRLKEFKSISYSKISNALFGNLSKILFGWINIGYIGLIIGMTIGLVVSNFWFIKDFFSSHKKHNISSSSPRNFVLAKEYIEFPKINLPHVLLDLGKDLLVAVLLIKLFSKEEFGLYDHSFRMLRLPLIFAGLAIGQVFFQKCTEMVNRGEDIKGVVYKSLKTLVLLSIVPFTVIFFFGEVIFSFVFGVTWSESGVYSQIMAPWLMVNFILSPISSLPLILKKQREIFVLAIIGAVLMISAIVIPSLAFDLNIVSTLWILSISQACFLIFTIFKVVNYLK